MDLTPSRSVILGLMLIYGAQLLASNSFCGGKYNLLAFIDRPSIGDSPCVVPEQTSVLESGYQYMDLTGLGIQQNLPESVYRIGLAGRFEFAITLPNYIHQTKTPKIGFTATALTVKHELHANERWVLAIEGTSILPSGNAAFGAQDAGGIFNGIAGYNLTSNLSLTGMLGITKQSLPALNGGLYYTSINPDLVLAWSLKDNLILYVEVYGQTHTGPDQGSGANLDTGISYLFKKNVALDLEVGKRLNGALGGFNQYLGTGIAVQFG